MKDILVATLVASLPGLIIYLFGVRDFKSWKWMAEGFKKDLDALKKWILK